MAYKATIAAISTPPGRGGIGIIRISGDNSLLHARQVIGDESFNPTPQISYLKNLCDPATFETIDKGLVTYFKAPQSFTGEDVVELSCHGSPVVLLRIINVLLGLGVDAAAPGEFTMRALVNKRLNLSEAEAIRDLINAQNSLAATQAFRQLNGELSFRLQPFKDELLKIIVPLESALEFVEEDVPQVFYEQVANQVRSLIVRIENLASTYQLGKTLKDGYKVTLVGRPNVGKSSVFNKLLATERSIITSVPGTTRDTLTEFISINGVPILLTDTAGIRSSGDEIEQLGIERTKRAVADADLAIAVFDGSTELTSEDIQVLSVVNTYNYLVIVNKADLFAPEEAGGRFASLSSEFISVSTFTNIGLDKLKQAISGSFDSQTGFSDGSCLITSARHHDLLRCTINSLTLSLSLIEQQASEEIVLIDLYNALHYLGDITGETTSEDVLSEIFATFCIGK